MSTDDPTPVPIPLHPLPERPLVSVLIANYNYARFLPITLDGLIAQTYPHFEAVVCDDGSTDGSAAVIQSYADRDPRFRLVRQTNGGQTAAVNECFRHLTGDVVCLLDADDTFAPDKLAKVVAAFAADPMAGVCTHHTRVVDALGHTVAERLNPSLDSGWLADTATERGACVAVPVTSAMSFRREVLAQLMPIPATQRRDCDGYLGMAAQFLAPIVALDEPLSDYRVHGKNMGGLTDPTPDRLHYELTLITERTDTLNDFLAARFGHAYADRIRVADNPQFVQAALKMHAIDPAHADVRDHPVASLIARHTNPKWQLMWRAIFAAPRPLRRRIVPALHRSYKLKAMARKLFVGKPQPRVTAPSFAVEVAAP
jgi:glycosyltransferase involved in cell wall biosynthesis